MKAATEMAGCCLTVLMKHRYSLIKQSLWTVIINPLKLNIAIVNGGYQIMECYSMWLLQLEYFNRSASQNLNIIFRVSRLCGLVMMTQLQCCYSYVRN